MFDHAAQLACGHATPAVGDNRLAALAADIRAAHAGVFDAAKTAAERAIEAGRALLEAKAMLKHGQWIPWLKQHCRLPQRIAQFYMRVARLGLEPHVVAAIGLKAAAQAMCVIYDPNYNPFAECDEEEQREWQLFVLFGIPGEHVEWLLRRPFTSVSEWLGPGGTAFRRLYGMREPGETFTRRWAAFQRQHADTPRAEIEAAVASLAVTDRKRNVADLSAELPQRRATAPRGEGRNARGEARPFTRGIP